MIILAGRASARWSRRGDVRRLLASAANKGGKKKPPPPKKTKAEEAAPLTEPASVASSGGVSSSSGSGAGTGTGAASGFNMKPLAYGGALAFAAASGIFVRNWVISRAQEDAEFYNSLPRFVQRQVPDSYGGEGGDAGGDEEMSLEEYEALRRKQLSTGIGFDIGSQWKPSPGSEAGKNKSNRGKPTREQGNAREAESPPTSVDLAPPAWLAKENPSLVNKVEEDAIKLAAEKPVVANFQRRSQELSQAKSVAMEASVKLLSSIDLPKVAKAVAKRDEALEAAEKSLADNAAAVDAYWKEHNIGWLPGYWATAEQRVKLAEFEREREHLEAVLKPMRESLEINPKMDEHPRGKDLRQFKSFLA